MRYLWLLGLATVFQHVCAQHYVPADTSDTRYRDALIQTYKHRVEEQVKMFQFSTTDKKVRKELENLYDETTSSFSKDIVKGYVEQDTLFQNQLDLILAKLQRANPDHKEIGKTKVLLSYGVEPNALAVGNDFVVTFVPLLMKIRNEYEIAFIISHEIAHNLLNHSYNRLIAEAELRHSEEVKKKTKLVEKTKYHRTKKALGTYKTMLYDSRHSSRKLEHQADSLGFILFRNAFPDREYEAVTALNHLKEIDKETDSLTTDDYKTLFARIPYREGWVNNDEMDSYRYDRTPKFWMVDSLKTHPDCEVRIEFLVNNFQPKVRPAEEASEHFQKIIATSRYSNIWGLYIIEEYGRSLYETLLLLKSDPENPFLRKMAGANFTKLQEAQKSYTTDRYLDRLNPQNSDSYNTFLYFVRELRRSEMRNIINLYQS